MLTQTRDKRKVFFLKEKLSYHISHKICFSMSRFSILLSPEAGIEPRVLSCQTNTLSLSFTCCHWKESVFSSSFKGLHRKYGSVLNTNEGYLCAPSSWLCLPSPEDFKYLKTFSCLLAQIGGWDSSTISKVLCSFYIFVLSLPVMAKPSLQPWSSASLRACSQITCTSAQF